MNKWLSVRIPRLIAVVLALTLVACAAPTTPAPTVSIPPPTEPGTTEPDVEVENEGTPDPMIDTEIAGDIDTNALLDLMMYHIAVEVYMASELAEMESVMMMSADPIDLSVVNAVITLNDDVQVIEEDIEACNGVIHIISKMLTKPDEETTTTPEPPPTVDATDEATQEPTPIPCEEGQTIADILRSRPNLSGFTGALTSVGLIGMLDQDGDYTVFAPPDGMFAAPTLEPGEGGTTGGEGAGGDTSGDTGSGDTGSGDSGGSDTGGTTGGDGGADDGGAGDGKVTICHATGSKTNPYVLITVDENGLNGHGGHAGDIIPAPPEGCPTGASPTDEPPPTAEPTEEPTDEATDEPI